MTTKLLNCSDASKDSRIVPSLRATCAFGVASARASTRTLSITLVSCLTLALSACGTGSITNSALGSLLVIENTAATKGTPIISLSGSTATQAEVIDAAVLSGLSCPKSWAPGSTTVACSVALSSAAPKSGLLVALSSDNLSVVVPAQINVPAGAITATFKAALSAVTSNQSVSITAKATNISKAASLQLSAASPKLTVSSQTLDFQSMAIGAGTSTQTLKLSSTGTAPLTIQALHLTGSAYNFSGPKFPSTLPPGSSVVITVQMNPKVIGSSLGSLSIDSNSAAPPATTVGLRGVVTAFTAELSGLFCGTATITGMSSDSCVAVLNGPAPSTGLSLSVSANDTALQVPTTVTVPSGQSKATFLTSRVAAGTASSVRVTVTHGSATRSVTLGLAPSSPIFSLPSGAYSNAVTLSLSDATPGVTIYYTVDGSAPSLSATRYTAPIVISGNQKVLAIASSAASVASATTGAQYQITTATSPIPSGSAFRVPQPDACQSPYDQFYESESGVYAYWPMCEAGTDIDIFDYVGNWSLSKNYSDGEVLAWGSGDIAGGFPGPVGDNETAAQATTTSTSRTNLGIPLNSNQGTVATWVQSQPSPSLEQALFFYSLGKSSLGLGTKTMNGSTCFVATVTDSAGALTPASQCGFAAESWNRVVMTWSSGVLSLFVNGELAVTAPLSGRIDDTVFNYRLFPACCGYVKSMSLAKALVANVAWTPQQVRADFRPNITLPPTGGVHITANELGTIHRDVLGFADDNSGITDAAQNLAVKKGLAESGVTAVRYANGSGGITADLENWQGGVACTGIKGMTQPALNARTGDQMSRYLPMMAQPLGLDIGFTINYGSNPPYCDAGGDAVANASTLAYDANVVNHYGIKYWEIGNEVFSASTEPDFHADAHTGTSYVQNEPAFYDAIKNQDPYSQVGVPISGSNFNTQIHFDIPVLAAAKYDAIVFHNYPIKAPISDSATLYRDRAATNMMKTRGSLLTLQTELLNSNKAGDAIWITEWSANINGNKWSKQSMGAVMPLFAASELGEYMRAGVKYATWWAQSSIDVCSNSNYDASGDSAYSWWPCGAAGLVYNGPNPGYGHEVLVGMAAGDLMPAAHAFQVLSQSGFVVEGEHMLSTLADGPGTPWLQSYAATHGNSYAVMLINRDRDSSHMVPLEFAGMSSGSQVKQWTYGRAQYDLTKTGDWTAGPAQATYGSWNGVFNATLPPWSVSVFVFNR